MPATADDLAHLLRRCGYLTTPATVAQWSSLELDQAVDKVLDFSSNSPDSTFNFVATEDWRRISEVRRWWLDRMATVAAPLQERLTFFWHGHFASSYWKIGNAEMMWNQNRILRANATGSFLDMAQQVALDPAMLIYLDNQDNYRGSPNENFARELMELFTMGADQGYTQADVRDVARAWTGYGLHWYNDGRPPTSEFHANAHDTGVKTIFGITKNWDGPEVISEIVNGSRRALCARFIARKLWSFFAYPNPDEALLVSLAASLSDAGMQIAPFLRIMFLRPEFYSVAARQGLVRPPSQWGVALHQATGRTLNETQMDYQLSEMGHCPFEPPNVSGWRQNEYWLTENTVWLKDAATQGLAWKAIAAGFIPDYAALSTPALVQRALDLCGVSSVSASTRSSIETFVSEHRTANASNIRYHLLRLVALSPEFGLA